MEKIPTPENNNAEHVRKPHFEGEISHGTLEEMADLMKSTKTDLENVIAHLPKRADELYALSKDDETTEMLFLGVVKQSFRYLETIIELQRETQKEIGTEEWAMRDELRGRTHDATIASMNAWSRALAKAGVNNSFLRSVVGDRATYGAFAVGLALDVYTNEALFHDLTK